MFGSPISASAPGFDWSAGPLLPGVSNSASFVLPVSVCECNPELTICPVPVHEFIFDLPVLRQETIDATHVCPINPVTATETIYELPAFLVSVKKPDSESSVSSDSVSRSDVKPFVRLISASGSEFEQCVYLAFITELSVNPVSVNASVCELSVGLYSTVKSGSELSACPVSISELTYELSVLSIVTRENIDGLVFPAPVLETVYALCVVCLSFSQAPIAAMGS